MIKAGEYFKVGTASSTKLKQLIKKHEYIYRYLPMEHLLDSLQNNKMVFINPGKWNDPFDNYLFKLAKKKSVNSFTSNLFCQCITLNPHSQAYWKTYGGNGFAARLQIKTAKYLNKIKNYGSPFWIGKMKYLRESILITDMKAIPNLKSDLSKMTVSDGFLKAFFLKRKPFEYENEMRLLIKSNPTINGLKKIKIDNSNLIEEIRLDPNMGKSEEKAWKDYLKTFKIKVTKSQLFTEKKILERHPKLNQKKNWEI